MLNRNRVSETTSFVGREDELAKIADLLASPDCRLLTLTGPGGIGKTRLAIQATAEQQHHFEHGVHFVPLTSINSADLVPAAIATALQVTFYSSDDLRIQIAKFLREKHMLLVMDNFEHVLEATDLLTELLQAAPDVKYLVTSRERLNLREEWVIVLDGLPFPKGDAPPAFEVHSATRLFTQRACQVQANFTLNNNLEAVQTICQQVEGMPLAIELAATWLRVMPCNQIAAQLVDSLDFLTSPLRNIPERHRSMRVVFEQSWTMLSADERHVLMYLSVFRGGFDREAAEQVAGASLLVLASLSDKSMIRLNAAERYDLHELLRQFAAEKLVKEGKSQAAHQRHCDYFLRLAEAADVHAFGREQIPWFDRLEIELDNLRAAVFWSLNTETGLRLAGAMKWFFSERGHWSDGLDWLERALAANPDASPSIRARALYSLAVLCDDRPRVLSLCDEAFFLAQKVNDHWNMAWALSHKGIQAIWDRYQSVPFLDASLALFREIEDPMGIAHTLVRISWFAWERQDYAYGRRLLDEAWMIAQEAGDRIMMGWAIYGLGIITRHQHNLEQARLQLTNAVAFFHEAHFIIGYDNSLVLLAMVEQELGNREQARVLYRDALLSLRELHQSDQYLDLVLSSLSWLVWASGKYEQAAILKAANSHVFGRNAQSSEIAGLTTEAAALRDYLGEALFTRLWIAGLTMTLDEAIGCLEDGAAQIINETASQTDRLETAQQQPLVNERLTERELEILRLLAVGLNSREIAEQLVLSVGTVRWYLKQIYDKLDAHSRSEAIARARELKLLI